MLNNGAGLSPSELRARCRAGTWTGPTTGVCLGHMQANLVVLPAEAASEFASLCEANPRALPLVDVTEPGDPRPRRVAPSAHPRTDPPRDRVHPPGELARHPARL